MRIRLVMKDHEYLKAFVEMASKVDQDLYMEIAQQFISTKDYLTVTDLKPADIGQDIFDKCAGGIVFLQEEKSDSLINDKGPFYLFKYDRISNIIADLRLCYFVYTGERTYHVGSCRSVAVFCDRDQDACAACSEYIGRQIAYRFGGKVLIASLSYIDPHMKSSDDGRASFKKMLYYIKNHRSFPVEAFFVQDRYGLYLMRCTAPLNPLMFLQEAECSLFFEHLESQCFDAIVYDIGNCFAVSNLNILRHADHRFFLYSSAERKELLTERLIDDMKIAITEVDLVQSRDRLQLCIDDLVRSLYGEMPDEEQKPIS